ncbi:MAG: hypothetical protein IIA87_00360 [Nanoarchaeota archaeon]|nr:hypothetical protein [Nanoarchaeota archaeon]
MSMDLVLQGDRYLGRFMASRILGSVECGSEYTSGEDKGQYWSGKGVIRKLKTSAEARFTFKTDFVKDRWRQLGDLEREMIVIQDRSFRERSPGIVEQERLYDFVLEQMYGNALELRDEEIIPMISIEKLQYEDLLISGVVAEEGTGQLMIPEIL